MIREQNLTFELSTLGTTYVFCVTESGHLEHLYYGRKITVTSGADASGRYNLTSVLQEKHAFAPGNTNIYSDDYKNLCLQLK